MTHSSEAPLSDADALTHLTALLGQQRQAEALKVAETWLAEGGDHPLPLAVVAAARRSQGRLEEAVALNRRRVALSGADPQSWAALAASLFLARWIDESVAAWTQAVELSPSDPQLLCGLANALRAAGRGGESEPLFRRALQANPGGFDATFGLAMSALEAGRLEEASSLSQDLAARFPGAPAALWLAARTAMSGGAFAVAETLAGRLLLSPGLGSEQMADAFLLRGEALDRLDRCAEAFDACRQGKALQRAFYAQRAAGREGESDKYRRLAAWFGAAESAAWGAAAEGEDDEETPAAGHAFLVGFPRSGTTLLEQILAGHPQVVALEEAPTLAEPYAELMTSPAGLERLAALSPQDAALWRRRYWAEVAAIGVRANGRLFLDKAPAGTVYLPLIAKLFPRAKILFAVRDPRDVVLSCFRSNFGMNAMTYAFTDLQETATCYDACMAMAEVCRRVLPLNLEEVRHEALINDPQGAVASICGFLGIVPTAQMLDVAATALQRTVRTPSADQVRSGLNRRGLGRWRAYAGELASVQPRLAPWVARFGYSD